MGRMFERFAGRARVYCPSCHTPIESMGAEMASGRFVVEGDGAQSCRAAAQSGT